jgi:outer membrane protein
MRSTTVLTLFWRACSLLVVTILVPAGWSQDTSSVPAAPSAQMQTHPTAPSKSQPFNVQEYANPKPALRSPLAPYTARHLPPPNLSNTPRIEELMRDGKLYISMNDAVALALENNLDIAIARYNLNIADTDIWRAKAGVNTILGVNEGLPVEASAGSALRLARAREEPRSEQAARGRDRAAWCNQRWAAVR